MRPALKAGLLPVWRDRDTLQFGVDPRRAVALGGLGPAAAVISLLDGSRDRDHLIATAQAYGIPAEAASRVLALLASSGVLDDFPSSLHACLPDRVRARLAPELATAALAYAEGDGGARTLARRRAAFVRVHGAGRTGACVASFLAASGVGHVACADPEPAEPADLAPAGLIEADLGAPRQEGAARAVGRAAPDVRTGDDGAVPDLVILTRPVLPDLAEGLVRTACPTWRYGPARRSASSARWSGRAVRPACAASTCARPTPTRSGRRSWPRPPSPGPSRRPATPCWPPWRPRSPARRRSRSSTAAPGPALGAAGDGERDAGGGPPGLAVAAPDLAAAPGVRVRCGGPVNLVEPPNVTVPA